ncbi:ABC transporter ATP-binding protein [soil metagenome]
MTDLASIQSSSGPDTDAPAIRARGLTKWFGTVAAVTGFDLDVAEGTVTTLLGPSGSGKTTALRLIAGFERPDAGTLDIAGQRMADLRVHVAPERRRVGMVFQDYALFPHLTVAANIGFGIAKGPERKGRVAEVIEMVGLGELVDRLPGELSGGEQQRVALARALAPAPTVILLDEPFSNLDADLRGRVRREVRQILSDAGTTAVFVTHDQEEALAMSDHVAVMRTGAVLQVATPTELYRRPADAWTARFLGDADLFAGRAAEGMVSIGAGTFPTDLTGAVVVMIRPETVRLAHDPDGPAVVKHREYFGHDQLVTVSLPDGSSLRSRLGPGPDLEPGNPVAVAIDEVLTFPG